MAINMLQQNLTNISQAQQQQNGMLPTTHFHMNPHHQPSPGLESHQQHQQLNTNYSLESSSSGTQSHFAFFTDSSSSSSSSLSSMTSVDFKSHYGKYHHPHHYHHNHNYHHHHHSILHQDNKVNLSHHEHLDTQSVLASTNLHLGHEQEQEQEHSGLKVPPPPPPPFSMHFRMGYRPTCEKCVNKVPGHFSHLD